MKVEDIMTDEVKTCAPDTILDRVAQMMWDGDCGDILVADDRGYPTGIVTDRDIAMSSVLNHKELWALRASDVTQERPLATCHIGDDVDDAIRIMAKHKVRRLPVVDSSGSLKGIISFGDLVSVAEAGTSRKKPELSFNDLMPVFKACCEHHRTLALR